MSPRRLAVCAVLGAAIACSSATPASAFRACGLTPRIEGVRYDVRETKGSVRCKTVKAVVTRFLRTGAASSRWTCFRGHGSSPYAASCSRGKRVVVRVYAPG